MLAADQQVFDLGCRRAPPAYRLPRAIDAITICCRGDRLDAAHNNPFLGICMGLQVLIDHSEENDGIDCIGCVREVMCSLSPIEGEKAQMPLKVPHMGWNRWSRSNQHPLWQDPAMTAAFISCTVIMSPPRIRSWLRARRLWYRFTSAIAKDNLFAAQFHPEKSAHTGPQLLKNFVNWNGNLNSDDRTEIDVDARNRRALRATAPGRHG